MPELHPAQHSPPQTVGLFVTCAVDLFRPSVGFASAKLIEQAGFEVAVPPQGCCGQVAYNNGLPEDAKAMAWQVVSAFEAVDHIVAPSGSCASMLKNHYPDLFEGDSRLPAVETFAAKVQELTCFLEHYLPALAQTKPPAVTDKTVCYHDSCAGLRELGIREQPRHLLEAMNGLAVTEIPDGEQCCGFGGTFCEKFDEISNRMVSDKIHNLQSRQPDLLLGGDLTCLLNIAGKLQNPDSATPKVRHVAEVLANMIDTPAIGEQPVEPGVKGETQP